MQRTTYRWIVVSTRLLAAPLALLAIGACSETPEQKLRDAGGHLEAAKEDATKAEKNLVDEQKRLEETKKKIDEDRKVASDAQKQVASAQGEVDKYASDEVVFREVQRQLLDDSKLLRTAVAVQVNQRVVTLTGSVPSAELRTRAGEIAKNSPGVKRVVNDVLVDGAKPTKPPASPAPPEASSAKTPSAAKPDTRGQSY